jgi:Putative ATP-binding cassette
MLSLFLKFEVGKWGKYIRTRTLAKTITMFLFVLVFLFVAVGIYGFFISGFRYIQFEAIAEIQNALNLFLYEVFLIILAGIGMFSALVSGIFNLFRGGNNTWVLGSSGYRFFPKMVFIKSFFSAMFPLLIMFIPAILALTKVYHLGIIPCVALIISVIFFSTFLNALVLLVILGTGYALYYLAKHTHVVHLTLKNLILALFTCIGVGLISTWKMIANVDLVHLFRAEDVSAALTTSTIGDHFMFLPTHPFALEILNWQVGDSGSALVNISILGVLALGGVVLWWLMSPFFYPVWQVLQEGNSTGSLEGSQKRTLSKPYYFSGGVVFALFKKEALISSRNWKGVLWFIFLALIWLVQIGANVIMGHNIQKYQPDVSQKTILLQVIQFIIAIYFISSFTLRFVFPSFSVEKKTAWILGSAPLSFKKLFFGKYFFYTFFFVTLGFVMNSINTGVLGLSFMHALYATLLFVTAIIFVVTLGLSLGALFPSTETDDPETISTSMPGLFFTALALMYGALADLVLYTALKQERSVWIVFFVIISLLITALFLFKVPSLAEKKAWNR